MDKDKLRELQANFRKASEACCTEQTKDAIWPMLILLGASMDIVITELLKADV